MPRKWQHGPHDQVEARIRSAGSIGELERLAGIGRSQDERAAFWQPYCRLRGAAALDAGVAELKRRIRARAGAPMAAATSGGRHHA